MTPNAIAVDAIFLVFFDDHRGQSLVWHRSKLPANALDGIEFQALPSGLHLVQQDAIYFTHNHPPPPSTAPPEAGPSSGSPRSEQRLCVAVFENKELSDEEVERAGKGNGGRGRRMMSLGVMMSPNSHQTTSFPPLASLRTLLAQIQNTWTGSISSDSPTEQDLDNFWKAHSTFGREDDDDDRWSEDDDENGKDGDSAVQQDDQEDIEGTRQTDIQNLSRQLGLNRGVSVGHPIRAVSGMINLFGPSFCTLWKYAAGGKRIMLYSQPPLLPVCQIAYGTWALSKTLDIRRKGKGRAKAAAIARSKGSKFLGCVGLMDMVDLQREEGGWIACTSDAIYKDRPQLYDLLVDLSDCDLENFATTGLTAAAVKTPIMIASIHPSSSGNKSAISLPSRPAEVTTKTISYSFSDMAPWKDCQFIVSGSSGSYPPNISIIVSSPSTISRVGAWFAAYSAYAVICDVCWGLCSLAVGRYGMTQAGKDAHARKHARVGAIRLNEDDEGLSDAEPLMDDEIDGSAQEHREREELDVFVDKALAVLRLLVVRGRVISRRIEKASSQSAHPALKSEDMTSIGLSAWSWTDVEFVRSLYKSHIKEVARDRVEAGMADEGPIVVKRGWLGWVSGMFWL